MSKVKEKSKDGIIILIQESSKFIHRQLNNLSKYGSTRRTRPEHWAPTMLQAAG